MAPAAETDVASLFSCRSLVMLAEPQRPAGLRGPAAADPAAPIQAVQSGRHPAEAVT